MLDAHDGRNWLPGPGEVGAGGGLRVSGQWKGLGQTGMVHTGHHTFGKVQRTAPTEGPNRMMDPVSNKAPRLVCHGNTLTTPPRRRNSGVRGWELCTFCSIFP